MCTEFNLEGYQALISHVIENNLCSEREVFVEEDQPILEFKPTILESP